MRNDLLPVTLEGKFSHFIEEACEVIKCVCKLQRFGEKPTDLKTGIKYDNISDLKNELSDLKYAIKAIEEHLK